MHKLRINAFKKALVQYVRENGAGVWKRVLEGGEVIQ